MVAEVQAALERADSVWKYLLKSKIREIMAKIFASDDYIFQVAGLVVKLQVMGRVALLQELKEEYFLDNDIKKLPEYMKKGCRRFQCGLCRDANRAKKLCYLG